MIISDEGLRGLGAVVSQWALAEQSLRNTLDYMLATAAVVTTDWPKERIVDFRRKQEAFKATSRLIFAAHPEAIEMAIFLAGRGKVIKRQRDQAAHWISGTSSTDPTKMRFIDMSVDWRYGDYPFVEFSAERLLELAYEIGAWSSIIGCFGWFVSFGGPWSWPHTVVGPPLDSLWPSLVEYREYSQTHPSYTTPTPSRRPRSSQE